MKLQREAKARAVAQILKMKQLAAIRAKAEIARFVEIAEMEVRLAEARAKARLIKDAAVKAKAEAYANELLNNITIAKE